ncbi:coiled-coil domain-containing protein 170-like [Entelurus aequoreus]|uniref:coiled-coil domain-containing protein 170-like n=1 Tax=Entelurus aequoreus TaxID=161455 RepID=UPI002B1DBFB5|nr:coiled-coil domain-containing protein 170-like [Entelurus aequoreus]
MESSSELQSKERERLKMRMVVLEERVRAMEAESRGDQEAVLRLASELDRERKKSTSSSAAVQELKADLDGLVLVRLENEDLVQRLQASRRVTEASRRESGCLEEQVQDLEGQVQDLEGQVQDLEGQVQDLEKKLQSSQRHAREAQDQVLQVLRKVSSLIPDQTPVPVHGQDQEASPTLDQLCSRVEAHLGDVCQQLSEEKQRGQSVQQRAEQQVSDLRQRLEAVEAELLAADEHHHAMRLDLQHHEDFLERLTDAMKVDAMAADVGPDMRLPLILSRAEQLVRSEGDAVMESKRLTFNLQRKLKTQKEQLESKGLHIQMLRKKLEEDKRSKSVLEDVHAESARLQKKVERLQGELRASRQSHGLLKSRLSAADLKVEGRRLHASSLHASSPSRLHASSPSRLHASSPSRLHASSLHASSLHASSLHASSPSRLHASSPSRLHASSLHASSLHASSLHASSPSRLHASSPSRLHASSPSLCVFDKLRLEEQSQVVQEQKKKLRQLRKGKGHAEKLVDTLTSDLQSQEKQSRDDRERLSSLTSSLAQLSASERELTDFRMVVSRLLGLNASSSSALPNHEIIRLLEDLLHSHHHHGNAPWLCAAHRGAHLSYSHASGGQGE